MDIKEAKEEIRCEIRRSLKDAYINDFTFEDIRKLWEEAIQEFHDFLEWE